MCSGISYESGEDVADVPIAEQGTVTKNDYTTETGRCFGRRLAPGAEEALQDEHGGYLIDHPAPVARAARRIQTTMGFGGREPLIPERDFDPGIPLATGSTGERTRESHHKIQEKNPIHQGPRLCDVF
jgi:hypothetical protein